MKKISISIPVYNEENNINRAYSEIKKFFLEKKIIYEIIFTDNNSTDNTSLEIKKICAIDSAVKYIRFNSNIGYDRSLLENYKNTSGDAAISIDCDLQDPISVINGLLEKWLLGHDLVYGIRDKRNEKKILTFFRKIFYRLLNFYIDFRLPSDAGDFRLIDRNIINNIKQNYYPDPYTRGLTFFLSKNPVGISYSRQKRSADKSKFGFFNLVKYAIQKLFQNSYFFQRLILTIFLLFVIFSLTNLYNHNSNLLEFIYFFLILIVIILLILLELVTKTYLINKNPKNIVYVDRVNI
jgi:dolichol-phosphate mannosyltransferase